LPLVTSQPCAVMCCTRGRPSVATCNPSTQQRRPIVKTAMQMQVCTHTQHKITVADPAQLDGHIAWSTQDTAHGQTGRLPTLRTATGHTDTAHTTATPACQATYLQCSTKSSCNPSQRTCQSHGLLRQPNKSRTPVEVQASGMPQETLAQHRPGNSGGNAHFSTCKGAQPKLPFICCSWSYCRLDPRAAEVLVTLSCSFFQLGRLPGLGPISPNYSVMLQQGCPELVSMRTSALCRMSGMVSMRTSALCRMSELVSMRAPHTRKECRAGEHARAAHAQRMLSW
jgi:hypothetical protein